VGEPLVIDPAFRDQFEMAKPTQRYSEIMQSLPQLFVGPLADLHQLVKLLCVEMHQAFSDSGVSIPPCASHLHVVSNTSEGLQAPLCVIKHFRLQRLCAQCDCTLSVLSAHDVCPHRGSALCRWRSKESFMSKWRVTTPPRMLESRLTPGPLRQRSAICKAVPARHTRLGGQGCHTAAVKRVSSLSRINSHGALSSASDAGSVDNIVAPL
jgi:hypothetical protein